MICLCGDEMYRKCLAIVAIAMVSGALAGCSETSDNAVNFRPETLNVAFELVSSEDVFIPSVEAVIVGDTVAIQGVVRRRPGNCCDTTKGIINVSVLTPDGDVFDEVDTAHSPRNIPKARQQSSRFIANLPYIVPDRFILRIEYQRS